MTLIPCTTRSMRGCLRSRDVLVHDEALVRRRQPRVPPHAPPAAPVAVLLAAIRLAAAAALIPAPASAAVIASACRTPPRIAASAVGIVSWPVAAFGRGLPAAAPTAGCLVRGRAVLLRARTRFLRVRRVTPRARGVAVSRRLLPAARVAGLPGPPTVARRVPAGVPAAPSTTRRAAPPTTVAAAVASATPSAAIRSAAAAAVGPAPAVGAAAGGAAAAASPPCSAAIATRCHRPLGRLQQARAPLRGGKWTESRVAKA